MSKEDEALFAGMLLALKEARQELYDLKHSHMDERQLAADFVDIDAIIARAEGRS